MKTFGGAEVPDNTEIECKTYKQTQNLAEGRRVVSITYVAILTSGDTTVRVEHVRPLAESEYFDASQESTQMAQQIMINEEIYGGFGAKCAAALNAALEEANA